MLCCAQINVILDSSSDLCPYVGLGSGKILGSVTDEEFLGLNSFVHAVGLSGP
jgi:hypothetical protein